MDESSSTDHLSSSLTDLMTSLMVIFILLLLVFVRNTASQDKVLTDVLLKELIKEMVPQGFSEKTIQVDDRDPTAILVIVPDRLMNFEIGRAAVKPDGVAFLKDKIPLIAGVLCAREFRDSVESIVVEGHTDKGQWPGTPQQSQNLNLQLSQNRSMAVVQVALDDLTGADRSCFLEKLSATGRGEQDYNDHAPPEESRRVIFRIRVRAKHAEQLRKAMP